MYNADSVRHLEQGMIKYCLDRVFVLSKINTYLIYWKSIGRFRKLCETQGWYI